MLFNSFDFALFFPLFLAGYALVHKKLHIRNAYLLAASYLFYGWWDWRFLFLIILSSAIDFVVGLKMSKTTSKRSRKGLLLISLLVNLGMLGYFKYANFFIESFIDAFNLFGSDFNSFSLQIVLPVGISFYTFQTLSYTIDLYRQKIGPSKNALAFFSFVAFFPQLVAGPIERASHLLPQFDKIYRFNYKAFKSGMLLALFGLFKKMVIADRLAIVVNEVYNNTGDYSGGAFAVATVFFAFQIYCDFSGYSDIAIGISRMMGFDLMQNFRMPYFSRSITDFWRRWHISLSTWFRDYVYIPLGGSRKGKWRTYFNLFAVFVISGLWHGAAWTFLIWGSIHGAAIVVEKATRNRLKAIVDGNLLIKRVVAPIFSLSLTFVLVCFAWIFFRANNVADSLYISQQVLNLDYSVAGLYDLGLVKHEFLAAIVSIGGLVVFDFVHLKYGARRLLEKTHFLIQNLIIVTIILLIFIFGIYGDENVSEFIYFQF